MIKEHCYSLEWLKSFKKQKDHKTIQIDILERMIYALHLLERLKSKGLEFVFKGGTSLVLLLEEQSRFSIDIDIICQSGRSELEEILGDVVEDSRFSRMSLDEHRSYKRGVPKAHYKFEFGSVVNPTQYAGTLLDILFEEPLYPETTERVISTKWIETEQITTVTTPTIAAITGDKLTAFAPNTIGIPYLKGSRDSTLEVCKQLFDLGLLFDQAKQMSIIDQSFRAHANQEIKYRKTLDRNYKVSIEDVLKDTIQTCLTIARREKNPTEDSRENFVRISKGVRSFSAGYLMRGHFRIEDALASSARVAFLAAKILTGDLSDISQYEDQDISSLKIENQAYSGLNKLRRQPDKSIFYYWFSTIALLSSKGM